MVQACKYLIYLYIVFQFYEIRWQYEDEKQDVMENKRATCWCFSPFGCCWNSPLQILLPIFLATPFLLSIPPTKPKTLPLTFLFILPFLMALFSLFSTLLICYSGILFKLERLNAFPHLKTSIVEWQYSKYSRNYSISDGLISTFLVLFNSSEYLNVVIISFHS